MQAALSEEPGGRSADPEQQAQVVEGCLARRKVRHAGCVVSPVCILLWIHPGISLGLFLIGTHRTEVFTNFGSPAGSNETKSLFRTVGSGSALYYVYCCES